MALEETFQITVDEAAIRAARDRRRSRGVDAAARRPPARLQRVSAPNRSSSRVEPLLARRALLRRVSLRRGSCRWPASSCGWTVDGLEHLKDIEGPVISPPTTRATSTRRRFSRRCRRAGATAWRRRWRRSSSRRTSSPSELRARAWFTNSLNYYLAALFFNAFPLPQREAGTRQTLRYIGELVGDGYSVLIFPEGRRTETGEIGRFQPGVGDDCVAARTCRSSRSGSRDSTACCTTAGMRRLAACVRRAVG